LVVQNEEIREAGMKELLEEQDGQREIERERELNCLIDILVGEREQERFLLEV
jgi:hypothetical protein